MAIAVAAAAFTWSNGILEQLGLSHQQAQQHILGNLVGDFAKPDVPPEDTGGGSNEQSIDAQLKAFRIPVARLLPAVAGGDKRAAARGLCAYVKDYISSAAFSDTYQTRREAMKPTEEPHRLTGTDLASKKEELKTLETQYSQFKGTGQFPPAVLKQFEDGITQLRDFVTGQSDPTPNRTKWLKQYPENPSMAVKTRLREYLTLLATVDFDAQLTGSGKKQTFVNPAYETQSLKWKAIYRAGRDVNDEVRAFVTQWLNELP